VISLQIKTKENHKYEHSPHLVLGAP